MCSLHLAVCVSSHLYECVVADDTQQRRRSCELHGDGSWLDFAKDSIARQHASNVAVHAYRLVREVWVARPEKHGGNHVLIDLLLDDFMHVQSRQHAEPVRLQCIGGTLNSVRHGVLDCLLEDGTRVCRDLGGLGRLLGGGGGVLCHCGLSDAVRGEVNELLQRNSAY